MNHAQISEVIRSQVWNDLGRFFVDLESGDPRPPSKVFISHKFTSPYIPSSKSETHTFNGNNVTVKQTEQPTMTLSLTVYADKKAEAYQVVMSLKDWFDFTASDYLSENGIVVVRIENVQDRTVLLDTEYEHRVGFDVILRVSHEVVRTTEYIEQAFINEGE